jgi:hypothetical protein
VGPTAGLDGFREEKNLLSLPAFEPWTVQPAAWSLGHCTDYGIPKHTKQKLRCYLNLLVYVTLINNSAANIIQNLKKKKSKYRAASM